MLSLGTSGLAPACIDRLECKWRKSWKLHDGNSNFLSRGVGQGRSEFSIIARQRIVREGVAFDGIGESIFCALFDSRPPNGTETGRDWCGCA
jgi:hypothetical protein